MTPKEKAQAIYKIYNELVENHTRGVTIKPLAKQCALIAVDEIIESSPRYPSDVDWDDCGATHQYYYEEQREEAAKFWKEVKQEIEKL